MTKQKIKEYVVYEFINETNPMKPKLIRKDFGSVETGLLST